VKLFEQLSVVANDSYVANHPPIGANIPARGRGGAKAADPAADLAALNLQFAEGTIFVGRTLYFVDKATSDVFRLSDDTAIKVWHQDGCGPTGLVQIPAGLLVACYAGDSVVAITLDGRTLSTVSQDRAGRGFVSPNDLVIDARGGVYFSASGTESDLGKVYYLGGSGAPEEVAANIADSNGVALSLDGKALYVAESRAQRLLVFTVAADGTLHGRRVLVRLPDVLAPGRPRYTPDGVRVDKRGRLYVGLYDGGGFAVFDPFGKLLKQVDVWGTHHANLAISPDGRYVYGTTMNDVGGGYRGNLYRVRNPLPE
jgi:sugar lactone lactonase YvrE